MDNFQKRSKKSCPVWKKLSTGGGKVIHILSTAPHRGVDKSKVIHRVIHRLSTGLSTGSKVIHIVIHRGCGQNVDNFYAMDHDTKKATKPWFFNKNRRKIDVKIMKRLCCEPIFKRYHCCHSGRWKIIAYGVKNL